MITDSDGERGGGSCRLDSHHPAVIGWVQADVYTRPRTYSGRGCGEVVVGGGVLGRGETKACLAESGGRVKKGRE